MTMPPPVVGPERQRKGATDEDVYLTCSLLKCLMLFFSSLIHHRKSTPQYPPHNGGGFTNGSLTEQVHQMLDVPIKQS